MTNIDWTKPEYAGDPCPWCHKPMATQAAWDVPYKNADHAGSDLLAWHLPEDCYEVPSHTEIAARVNALEAALSAERARTDRLVDSLPKCDNHPDRPATKALKRGGGRWCDECGPLDADYPRAAALREIAKARGTQR